jgi:cytochrome c5
MQSKCFYWMRRISAGKLAALAGLAVFLFGNVEASAQTNVRSGERSGKEVVEAICAKCHATGEKGSPRIGQQADWSKRLSHGLDELVMQAIRGHGGMPARGGQAALTDNEVRNAIIYMFNPGSAATTSTARPSPVAATKSTSNVRVVSGTEIYLGLLPAEVLRSYPKDSVERSMHGGVPGGSGHYHVNISLLDAATKAPIPNAKVEIKIDERGFSSETTALQPLTINSAPSYGNYVRLRSKSRYLLTVKIQRADSARPIEATFDHQVY